MYFITTVSPTDMRCVGYVSQLKNAIRIVENNHCDINEAGYYPHVVIEHIEEGLYEYDFEPLWYKWNPEKNKYEESETPSYITDQTVGFAIG